MCGKGFVRRFVPFFLTFAVGLFVASFFVSIALPKLQFNGGLNKHRRSHQMMEFESQRLKEENLRLKKQLAQRDNSDFTNLDFENNLDVPPPPPIPPAPPAPFRPAPARR